MHHFFGGIAILGTFYNSSSLFKEQIFSKKTFQYILLFLFVTLFTTMFSSNFLESIKYWFVMVYGVCFLFSFCIAFRDVRVKTILLLTSVSLFVSSLVGFYDFIALYNNWVTFNKCPEPDKIISGFLYFGNTADYAHLMICILLPLLSSKLYKQFNVSENIFILISVLFGMLMLFGTTRISVIISFFLSLVLMIIFNFKNIKAKRLLYSVPVFIGVVYVFFIFFPTILFSIKERIALRILDRKPNDLAGNFFVENIEKSFQIFQKYPLSGIGLGQSEINVTNQVFNVHGTYFRLLAETGVFGCISFILVVFSIFYLVISKIPRQDKTNSFFHQFLPFIIGIFISSIYNVHFFRVEFWFFLAVVFLLSDGLNKGKLEERKERL